MNRGTLLFTALLTVAAIMPAMRAEAAIACDTPITASITLDANLTCSGNGLVAGANNITIDLGGHSVNGPVNGTGTGVTTNGHSHVVVRHGSVNYFGNGVVASGSQNVVEGIYTYGNYHDALVGGSHETIVGNIFAGGLGGIESDAASSSIVRNEIASSGFGVLLDPGACCTVDGNIVKDAGTGFKSSSPGVNLTHNVAIHSTDDGFELDAPPGTVADNIAFENDSEGFLVRTNPQVVFENNVANDNGFAPAADGRGLGFDFADFNHPRVEGNIAVRNDDPANCTPATTCAFAGKPLPVQAPPPCGSTITHSVKFNAGMSCTAGNGYTIGARHVVVDLGGFEFKGVHGTGFTISGRHATIRNGLIVGFDTGVKVSGKHDVVEALFVDLAAHGIDVSGTSNRVVGTVAATDGIGISATASKGSTRFVEDVALMSSKTGFTISGNSKGVRLDTNIAFGLPTDTSKVAGAFDLEGKHMTVEHNVAYETYSDGFDIAIPTTEKISANLANRNEGDGFRLTGSHHGATLNDNVADSNGIQAGDDNIGLGFEIVDAPHLKAKNDIASANDDPSECSPQISC